MMLPLPGGTAPPRPVMALAVGQPAMRRSPVSSCVRRRQWMSRLKVGPAAAAGPGFQARLLSVMTAPGPRGPGRREFQRSQCCQCVSRVIGAASAVGARERTYGKEKVYGSIP
jgi:hypothetical protein